MYITLPKDFADKVAAALNKAGATQPCQRCSNPKFEIVEGIINQPLSVSIGRVEISGSTLPLIAVVCTKCGNVLYHSIGALGLTEALQPNRR